MTAKTQAICLECHGLAWASVLRKQTKLQPARGRLQFIHPLPVLVAIRCRYEVDSDEGTAYGKRKRAMPPAAVVSVPVGLGFHAEGTCVGEYSSDISM